MKHVKPYCRWRLFVTSCAIALMAMVAVVPWRVVAQESPPEPGSTSLADAVKQFNAEAKTNKVGKDQPPLTTDEVVAAIRWTVQDKQFADATKEEYAALEKVAETKRLPKDARLEVQTDFTPGDELEYKIWSIRLQMPRGKPHLTYGFPIREQFVDVKRADPYEVDSPPRRRRFDNSLTPAAQKIDESLPTLADAIERFNAKADKSQPPLTENEVVAALYWTEQKHHDENSRDNRYAALEQIAKTRRLPKRAEFYASDTFKPGDGYQYKKWSVRLVLPPENEGSNYPAFLIRHRFIGVRQADPYKSDSPPAKVSSAVAFSPRSVNIDHGNMQVQLPNVGHLEVDGPASLELIGEKRIRVDRGRVVVRVTDPSESLTVETSDGKANTLVDGASIEIGADGKARLYGRPATGAGFHETQASKTLAGKSESGGKNGDQADRMHESQHKLLIGTWRGGYTDNDELVFRADGTFTQSIPDDGADRKAANIGGASLRSHKSGTWKIAGDKLIVSGSKEPQLRGFPGSPPPLPDLMNNSDVKIIRLDESLLRMSPIIQMGLGGLGGGMLPESPMLFYRRVDEVKPAEYDPTIPANLRQIAVSAKLTAKEAKLFADWVAKNLNKEEQQQLEVVNRIIDARDGKVDFAGLFQLTSEEVKAYGELLQFAKTYFRALSLASSKQLTAVETNAIEKLSKLPSSYWTLLSRFRASIDEHYKKTKTGSYAPAGVGFGVRPGAELPDDLAALNKVVTRIDELQAWLAETVFTEAN